MRARPVVLSVVGVLTLTIAAAGLRAQSRPTVPGYRLATIDRGSVASTVRASGTLTPVQQVAVSASGTGLLQALLIDDNAAVHAGDVLGRLDQTAASSHLALARSELVVAQRGVDVARSQRDRARIGVANAQATRAAAEAELAHASDVRDGAQRDLQRERSLARTGDAARVELERAQATADQAETEVKAAQARLNAADAGVGAAEGDVQVAEAQLQNVEAAIASHEAAVHDAEVELDHTLVRAPIDGVILDHTAVVGQVVTGAPGLFTIASDLHRMRLHASVDEADIGQIAVGQPASFNVDSFPGETFDGRVQLVKRAPQTAQNVVTYDVVIAVDNPTQKLLPGMTATTQIVTGKDEGMLRVPSAALRFRPEGEVAADGATVWTVDAEGHPVPHRVEPGRSDGALTTIVSSELAPGDAVVVALAAAADTSGHSHSLLGL